ncbi:MAG TPA: winged helix-turn-helix domain-containing protein [Mycobacteriales bacterium]|nr:winged helix-turn-helix domain-containing protein [Mycobacteriales bacterium]
MSSPAQLRRVMTTQGDRYAVAAIVVQESLDGAGTAELTALATRLADEARRLLLEERPGTNVTAAVAVSAGAAAAAPIVLDTDTDPGAASDGAPGGALDGGEAAGPGAAIEVDRHAYQARVDGRVLGLSFREFELLAFLTENPGRVFSRRQLVSSVWEGAAVGARTVDVHVRRLRMKLGRHADRITTVRNVGYRFEPGRADLETVA